MTIKKLLGISLALIMLVGSTPFVFSEPLRVQLELGIDADQIQCDNDSHVFVQRTHGKLACVTERTAERTGWEMVSMSSNIVYEYPLYASDIISSNPSTNQITMPTDSAQDGPLGKLELTLSKIPKVGETAKITIDFTMDVDFSEWEQIKEVITPKMGQTLSLRGGLEFVDDSEVIFNTPVKEGTYYRIEKGMPLLSHGDSITWTTQIKAVNEGVADIRFFIGGGGNSEKQHFKIYVGEQESLLYGDYIKIYGEPVTIQAELSSEQSLSEEEKMQKMLQEMLDGIHVEEQADTGTTTVRNADEVPEEEMRQLLRDVGFTDEEIEQELDRIYRPASTQSFLPQAFATTTISISGKLTVDDLPISPLTNHGILDVKVCVLEYDFNSRQFIEIKCTYTSDSGAYFLNGITPTGSDGTVDVYLTYRTDGRYSLVALQDSTNVLGAPYIRAEGLFYNVQNNLVVDKVLDTTIGSADYDNVFWILDAMADGRDKNKDVFDKRMTKVNVYRGS